MDSNAFLVVGNIGKKGVETFSQMQDSFDLIRNIGITSVNISYLTPHSGTEALKTIQSLGYQIDDVTEFIYNKPHFSTPEWSKKELEEFVTIEYKLSVRSHRFIFWLLRVFVRNFKGVFF